MTEIQEPPVDMEVCEINLSISRNRLSISATVSALGIKRLKQVLDKCEEILELLKNRSAE